MGKKSYSHECEQKSSVVAHEICLGLGRNPLTSSFVVLSQYDGGFFTAQRRNEESSSSQHLSSKLFLGCCEELEITFDKIPNQV